MTGSLPQRRTSKDGDTDDLDLSTLHESGLTQTYQAETAETEAAQPQPLVEANIILIAHPDDQHLGSRFRLGPGTHLVIGRDPDATISLPEVLSISRHHARLDHRGNEVTLSDLGSTNGTYVNGQLIGQPTTLQSGDRFQVAAVHFKFLHEEDVEHAYYEAIYDLLSRDGLTEIYNKRKYLEEAEREVARSRRHGRPLSIITFDLDQFKEINDTYGHLCGDFVLKSVVQSVKELLRPEQIFARFGGDEFVILTPETGLDGARVLAEKLCARIQDLNYDYLGVEVPVTCSFGVAEWSEDMKTIDDLYGRADAALFRSKRDGRARVSTAQ